jgi:hypothetical protein
LASGFPASAICMIFVVNSRDHQLIGKCPINAVDAMGRRNNALRETDIRPMSHPKTPERN